MLTIKWFYFIYLSTKAYHSLTFNLNAFPIKQSELPMVIPYKLTSSRNLKKMCPVYKRYTVQP